MNELWAQSSKQAANLKKTPLLKGSGVCYWFFLFNEAGIG